MGVPWIRAFFPELFWDGREWVIFFLGVAVGITLTLLVVLYLM